MNYVMLFTAGALLCNGLPHLLAGLQGMPFPTPFAKPRGVGLSPPLVNYAWGAACFLLGGFIFTRRLASLEPSLGLLALAVGFLAAGAYLAFHFGKVRGNSGTNAK